MRRVLILDTETTGIDPATEACIEVACVVFDVALASPIVSFASLINHDSNAMEKVNGIPAELLAVSPPPEIVWPRVEAMARTCDAILAHSAVFDRGFVSDELRDSKPWICTKDDLGWPKQTKPGQSLVALALAHGLGVASAHRALADCDLLSRLLSRIAADGVDLAAFLARGLRPKATFQAIVSFADKDKAKDAGFAWEPESKRWLRTLAIEDAQSFPFQIRKVA